MSVVNTPVNTSVVLVWADEARASGEFMTAARFLGLACMSISQPAKWERFITRGAWDVLESALIGRGYGAVAMCVETLMSFGPQSPECQQMLAEKAVAWAVEAAESQDLPATTRLLEGASKGTHEGSPLQQRIMGTALQLAQAANRAIPAVAQLLRVASWGGSIETAGWGADIQEAFREALLHSINGLVPKARNGGDRPTAIYLLRTQMLIAKDSSMRRETNWKLLELERLEREKTMDALANSMGITAA